MGYQSKGHRHSEIFFSLIKRMHDTSWPVVDQRYLRTTFRRSSKIFSESASSMRSSACSSDKIGSSSGYPSVYSTQNVTWTYGGSWNQTKLKVFKYHNALRLSAPSGISSASISIWILFCDSPWVGRSLVRVKLDDVDKTNLKAQWDIWTPAPIRAYVWEVKLRK